MPAFIFIVFLIIIIVSAFTKGKNGTAASAKSTMSAPTQKVNASKPVTTAQASANVNKANVNRTSAGNVHHDVYDDLTHYNHKFDELKHPRLDAGVGMVARRHEEWEPIHNGYQVIKCCYCGAGNEVPRSGHKNYKCYFCWKQL